MIGISKLYCGTVEPSDALRYGRLSSRLPSHLLQFAADKKPVVVWNCTRACNLACLHCYAHADAGGAANEMTHEEGRALIDDLAAFGSPVILFSGGEPLCRPDLPELAAYAVASGMRAVISTNGTRITAAVAERLKAVGLSYVGISLDGLRETNDRFRGVPGAFDQALAGIRACRRAGIKVGLRCTLTRHNQHELDGIFDLLEAESIPRICFYHLVYSGRGEDIAADDLSLAESRRVLDRIIDRTADLHARGLPTEVLTVDNHCDGPYLYLRLQREGRVADAERVMQLLEMNGGSSSGHGIGCVSWDGEVFPDQFMRQHSLGNVRQRPFSDIWTDAGNPFLQALKDKTRHVTGKCVHCRFLSVCGGNSRSRAEAATGAFWGVDPACYLTDDEISPPSSAAADPLAGGFTQAVPEAVEPLLRTRLVGRPYQYFDEIDSTNTFLHRGMEALPEGATVVADAQHAGRGRLQREWFSPPGVNVYLSVLLKPAVPPMQAPPLSLVAAAAVLQAIHDMGGVEACVKWPNDILWQGRKLAGILCEMSAEADRVQAVILGIGVNANQTALPASLAQTAISLQEVLGHPVSVPALTAGILNRLDEAYANWSRDGLSGCVAFLNRHAMLTGQQVSIALVRDTIRGRVECITQEGLLRLMLADGSTRDISSGEVQLCRPGSLQ